MRHSWNNDHRFHHIPVSIFLKLTGILVITGAILTILVIGFFRSFYTDTKTSPFRGHIHQYATYIVNDIGFPADTLKAKFLAERLDADVRIVSASGEWKTGINTPALSETVPPDWEKRDENIRFGEVNDRFFVEITAENQKIILFPENSAIWQPDWRKISILLVLILFILALSYLVIRRILKPLRLLMDGIRQISNGDLNVTFPEKRDEFGAIGRMLTTMTGTIQSMIRSREQLLTDVSHELRSPVTRVRLAAEMLGDHPQRNGMIRDLQEMDQLITLILESERIKNPNGGLVKEMVDLNQLLKDITDFPGYPLSLSVTLESGAINVHGDKERLRILFRNLLDNAGKYGKSRVELTTTIQDGWVIVRLSDDGPGISSTDLPHVFEPFFRADKSRTRTTGGFGLGLSMCKAIVETHEGHIDVTSEPGKTEFRVTLKVSG